MSVAEEQVVAELRRDRYDLHEQVKALRKELAEANEKIERLEEESLAHHAGST